VDRSALYRQVAELHIANINQGFLASLGVGFLSLMYEAIDTSPTSTLLVSESDGCVVGFVAGGTSMLSIYMRMLRNWPRLTLSLLPALLSPRRVWRIIEIIRHSGRGSNEDALAKAELLSIAIDPAFRGAARADALYAQLADQFRLRGLTGFKIVVGSSLSGAHKFYQRMGAHPVGTVEVHGGERSIVYFQSISGKPSSCSPIPTTRQLEKSEPHSHE